MMKKYREKFYETLPSTNDFALENVGVFEDKTVLFAKTQTDGHGRFDRVWVSSEAENIYATIILKPKKITEKLSCLTHYLCVILSETLGKYGVKPSIKWPNDILVNGKKISGILAQSSIIGSNLNGVVLGVGINLNTDKEILANVGQPATSLSIELNKKIDKTKFADNLFSAFFEEYDEFLEKGFEYIKERYCDYCSIISKEVTVKNFDRELTGIAEKINDDGSLELKLDNGKTETIRIGDLTCMNY